MSQYFTLFRLKPVFDIDVENSEQTYRALAVRFHPDKLASASTFEQKQAVMMSSTTNEAYCTLKSPIDHATYLLKIQGIDADVSEHTSFSPGFPMQQMGWRGTLMDAQMEQNHDATRALDQEIQNAQSSLYQDLRQAFEQQDYESAA